MLKGQQRYHELFEIRKMQLRRRLGLPLVFHDAGDGLDEPTGRQLEDGLIAACREVGMLLLDAGRIHEGWTYLRPVGDKATVAKRLAEIDVSDENVDQLIAVAFDEAVDVARGYSLVLSKYGTCNSITALEGRIQQLSVPDRQKAVGLLVRHVHQELKANLMADIADREGREPADASLHGLIADRDWLFGEYSYHLDTTHLAATVRFARFLADEPALRLAIDLTDYGRRLNQQFQYAGEEPFAENYPSHALFFQAQAGEEVDAALAYFRQKAETVDVRRAGPLPAEVYVELLTRLGRYDDALEAAMRLLPADVPRVGFARSLMELAEKAGRYDRLLDYCRSRNDLLGYAVALVHCS
jgi:tetratricopeptide (TPR) repeat protein